MSGAPSSEFIEECLKAHNNYRSQHGSPNLKISDQINKFAQEWAVTLATKNMFEHRDPNQYGENLYSGYNSDPNWKIQPADPIKSWYDEIASYKFGEPSPKNLSQVGHFTQLVWKNSTTLGVGMAYSSSGHVYVVCNYEPAGNFNGEFHKNVLPRREDSKVNFFVILRIIDRQSKVEKS